MKPIKLKIKGINSFVETCEIDFEELSAKGLFGIFGPTGSGKSTILDGMTLALYGEIPRNTKLFVNNRSNSAAVSFEFQISGAVNKRYRVEREFKSNENGSKPSSKGRLVELGEENKVIADKTSKINEEITKIIGLTQDDFSRTVVLPQGKFSEFLKLEGAPKRDMLERIFDLQQYGETLSTKINHNLSIIKTEYNSLQGYLSSFEDLKDFNLDHEKEEINELKIQKLEFEKKYNKENEEFSKLKEQYKRQQELQKKEEELKSLETRKAENEELKLKIKEAEQIARERPYINGYLERKKEEKELAGKIKLNTNMATNKEIKLREIELEIKLEKEKFENIKKVNENKEKLLLTINPNKEARDILLEIEKVESSIANGEVATKEKEIEIKDSEYKLKCLKLKNKELNEVEIFLDVEGNKIKEELDLAEKKLEEIKNHELVESISHTLKDGDNCPVCGNIYRKIEGKQSLDIKTYEDILNKIKEKKKVYEQKEKENIKEKSENEAILNSLNKNIEALQISLIKYNERLDILNETKDNYIVKAKELLSINLTNEIETQVELRKIKEKEKQKEELQVEMTKLRKSKDEAAEKLSKIKEVFSNINTELERVKAILIQQKEQEIKAKKAVDQAKTILEEILGESVENIDFYSELQELVEEKVIESWKKKVEQYDNLIIELTITIANIRNYVKVEISEEKFVEAKSELEEKESKIKSLGEHIAIKENILREIQRRLKEEAEKRKELEKVEKKMFMLEELKRLFAGKKFVSYVARNQLSYISKEASKRLMDISSSTYALEVDEDEKFMIIDYKNGGAKRDVSSLSGGEVFIASFALALALANHIQLKGANLELFFLDEGFGALDENLLDTVMESIEKIKSDKLSIGLISHVESIKKRLPIKLIVTPSEAGGAGSKVKVEYE